MKAVDFPERNRVLVAPGCFDLPVRADGQQCVSAWEPSPEEIFLTVQSGETSPPVGLAIGYTLADVGMVALARAEPPSEAAGAERLRIPTYFRTLLQLWIKFARRVLPAGAGDVQRIEMRRAFYAGFETCLRYQRDVLGDTRVNEDDACLVLEGWTRELEQFRRDIQEGRA